MFSGLIDWLERHQMSCIYKKYLGIHCPGCGMQRSLILLLKGDIVGSIVTYPALIPMIMLILGLVIQLIFRFEKGGVYLKFLFIFAVIIIMFNFIIKFY